MLADVTKFLADHYGDLAAGLVAAATLGSVVARFTKTDADDRFFAKALSLVSTVLRRAPSLGLDPAHKTASAKVSMDA
jgi:hypothetical protein